jgi:hypothetical protein
LVSLSASVHRWKLIARVYSLNAHSVNHFKAKVHCQQARLFQIVWPGFDVRREFFGRALEAAAEKPLGFSNGCQREHSPALAVPGESDLRELQTPVFGEARAAQVRAAQVRASQVRAAHQVRAAQVRAYQVRAAQVRTVAALRF